MSRETSEPKSFGLADKIGYMFGDFGNDFTFLLSSTYLMKFYTDVMGVDAIYNITCLIPAAGFVLLALALLFIYPLNKKRVDSNIAYLKEKNAKKGQ